MTGLADIEAAAREYQLARDVLADTVTALQAEIDRATNNELPHIREAALACKARYDALFKLIDTHRDLFAKPKTRTLHGIKCGLRKQPGAVEIDDEEKTIARIRALLPKAQADLLIRTVESVDKNMVGDLTADDLNRLGIRVGKNTEAVVVSAKGSDIDKIAAALLETSDTKVAKPEAA